MNKLIISILLLILFSMNSHISYGSENTALIKSYIKSKDDLSRSQWGNIAINLPSINGTYTGKDIIVAVLDTGVDGTHPELSGKLVDGYSTIDDKVIYKDENSDFDGHGTHVSGIIASKENNQGITGVAPNAKIMPIKVLSSNGGSDLSVANGIRYAVENGADIINLSLGGERKLFEKSNNITCEAIKVANRNNIPVVVASGNQGSYNNPLNLPAGCKGAISVAALNKELKKSYFSSYDSTIFISAPGVDILSTIPHSNYNNFAHMSGTSMAAPFISGSLALLLEKYPNISYGEVIFKLKNSTLDIDIPGKDPNTGYGIIDLNKLLNNKSSNLTYIKRKVKNTESAVISKAISNTKETEIFIKYNSTERAQLQYIIYVNQGIIKSFKMKNNSKKITIPLDAWKGGYLVLAIKYKDRYYYSDNFTVSEIKFPYSDKPEYIAKISNITTKWVESGIEVKFDNDGENGIIDITLLDWNYSLVYDNEILSNNTSFIIPISNDSELRAHYNLLLMGSPGKLQNTYIDPQYFLFGSLSVVDQYDYAIKGTSVNLCFQNNIACQGDTIQLVNYESGEIISSLTVLEDLTFSIIIPKELLAEKNILKVDKFQSNVINMIKDNKNEK